MTATTTLPVQTTEGDEAMMKVDTGDTALVITDPQNDFLLCSCLELFDSMQEILAPAIRQGSNLNCAARQH